MKGKILKASVIILLIITMTIANFIFVGNTLISYALDNISTNNNNIEFSAYFKNENGEEVTNIERGVNSSNTNLYFRLKVKKQGYFNGKIILNESNFKLGEAQSTYINKIEGNVITLNQINAGEDIEIDIPVKFTHTETFDLSLLSMESKIRLEGIYKDSSEKDKEIEADKVVTLKIVPENIAPENIESSIKILTNKTLTVAGEEKRVVQLLLNIGLKDNNYPIKEMNISTNIPDMNSEQPQVTTISNLNTMTNYQDNYENKQLNINFQNNKTEENTVLWKNSGSEAVVLTYLYKATDIEDIKINGKLSVTLYDEAKIEADLQEIVINKDEEKEEVVTTNIEQSETTMYKGKLYQGIDRDYATRSSINVNTENIINYMEIKEKDVFAKTADYEINTPLQGTIANVIYKNTVINKEQLFNILGEEGNAVITNENGETITTITKDTQAGEDGNIVINYGDEGQKGITIKTTAPVKGGKIDITNYKTIKQIDENLIKDSINFNTALFVTTNLNENTEDREYPKQIVKAELKDTVTEATLETNKRELSTVIENEIELKAVLKSKNESNDLYKNPILNVEFPEDVEAITINDVSIMYEEELKIKNYTLNGRVLKIEIEGEQTQYSGSAVEGTNIVINAKIKLNKKSATKDTKITMTYANENAKAYANEGKAFADIKVVAPTDVTTVTTIEQLNVEEVSQDTTKEVMLKRGTEQKEITPKIEVINNKNVTIKDVKVLGNFPTEEGEGAVGINITSPINVENGTVYYTENENATDDLSNQENKWSEQIQNQSSIKKYLIVANEVNSQDSIVASYNAVIPANLEYNENASQDYQVTYTDSETNLYSTVKSTQLTMTTGTGPKLEAKITAKVGNDEIKDGDQVKAGEVIKYHIEVANTGTEVVNNVTISSPVPQGTTYVQAKKDFEFEGASYYVEVEKEKCEETIAQIPVGEKITREYEVRVNKDIINGTNVSNKCTAKFDDVTTESNEINTILNSGDIRVSVKRITTGEVILYKDQPIKYYVLVENISSKEQKDIKLNTKLTDGLKVVNDKISLITGSVDEELSDKDNLNSTDITYSEEINLGDFAAGEMKLLYYIITPTVSGKINLSMTAKQGTNAYRSNVWEDGIIERKVEISIHSEQEKYVKSKEPIEYEITVKNIGTAEIKGLVIYDKISNYLDINNITIDGEKIDIPEEKELTIVLDIEAGKQKVIKISTTTVDEENIEINQNILMITNQAIAEYAGEEIGKTEEITHIMQLKDQIIVDEDKGDFVEDDGDKNPDNNTPTQTKIISGIAWNDQNANGKKDDNETVLSGITVNLLNVETNQLVKDKSGKILTAITGENGTYILSNIPKGKYIVIFNYDTNTYKVTKYKTEGIEEAKNSNVMMNEITIEGNKQNVASTDIIQIDKLNISDINIGLIKLQNFDLKLEKFVNKILIQNSAGTTVKEYNDATMAKAEIHSKLINGSTVIIEYKIKVTNVGEVDGYVKKIADYIPSDLKFSSELNKTWYQTGSNLYNTSLANEKLLAGESKEITLVLTKTMTENNIGRVNNTAEIVEDYNELGLEDSNSTPGNRAQGENDMGSADVIISIETGEAILYTSVTIMFAIAILGVVTIVLTKKIKKNKITHKFDKV